MKKPAIVLAILALGLLTACGRKAPLDTPVSIDQATPGTAAAEEARNPPLGPDGKPVKPRTQAGPKPAAHSFPLDPLLQ